MNTVGIIIAAVLVIGMGVLAILTEYGGKDEKPDDKLTGEDS